MKISANIIRQLLSLGIILGLVVLVFQQLAVFIPSLLGAITLYVLTRKFYFYLTEKRKWNRFLTTITIFISSIIVILIPFLVLVKMIISKVNTVISYSEQIGIYLQKYLNILKTQYNIDLFSEENIKNASTWVGPFITGVVNTTAGMLSLIFFAFFIFYFMLTANKRMEFFLLKWIPLKKSNTEKVGKKIHSLVLSNAVGIPVVALAQGVTGLVGYAIFGVTDLWFWFAMTTIASMIPIVGSALAYVPIAIILFASGNNWEALGVLLYGVFIIGTVDNIFRFTLLKKMDDIHPLITVFGVILGVNLFGFIGLIFGPLLLSLLFFLIGIYNNEFNDETASDKNQTFTN